MKNFKIMKKISLLLALVLTLVCACAIFGACQPQLVDYAAELKFEQGTLVTKEVLKKLL